ncbi:hypothetical protein E6C27_scaffold126G00100 [Cucumis melo var. makuwa]|uniref:Uncharacterized protein n=1 Tax=Cucumis melo var. makuwa TaxID=1194695 RepID=A0A5A7USK8_CUCMM|nr:hypothetical protein E6C27_scaffold126G00100 [Cucumis melo var. makuwa]
MVMLCAWSSHPDCLSVTPGFTTDQQVLGAPPNIEDQIFVPTEAHVTPVRERVEAEVGAKASWRATRSDRGEP